jgi:hypothetical protein
MHNTKTKASSSALLSVVLSFAFLAASCGSGASSKTEDSSGDSSKTEDTTQSSKESSQPETDSNSAVDEKIKASVKCTVTDVDQDAISIDPETELVTIGGKSYLYYDESVTVTNYTDDAAWIYIKYRLVDVNGRVFDTSNFGETVSAGETLTIVENNTIQPATDIVVQGNSTVGETTFECPVVEASLSPA